jgi:hypothetical protein
MPNSAADFSLSRDRNPQQKRTSGTLPNRSKVRSYAVRGHLAFWGEGDHLHGGERVKELAGKTAFVTGAASGIGLGIATAFAQAGAKVMLCDVEEAALSAALKQLRLTNVDVDGVKADVSLKAELVAGGSGAQSDRRSTRFVRLIASAADQPREH